MSTKIRVVAVVASAAALTSGVAIGAQAATKVTKTSVVVKSTRAKSAVANPMTAAGVANPMRQGDHGMGGWTNHLASLVTAGKITQAQADAITAAYNAAEAAEQAWDAAATKTGTRPDDSPAAILADLVKKGTISQAVSDAITAAFPVGPKAGGHGMGVGPMNDDRAAEQALIASTLGIDVATLQSKLAAGNSLATIAGDKKAALIAALVAYETKEIDAAVAAGRITAAQATTIKADLTARVTARVEAVRGQGGMGMGGHGRGGHGFMGGNAPTIPNAGKTNS